LKASSRQPTSTTADSQKRDHWQLEARRVDQAQVSDGQRGRWQGSAFGWSGPGVRQFFEQRETKGNKKPGAVAGFGGWRWRSSSAALQGFAFSHALA
jgi:hypothetical protein